MTKDVEIIGGNEASQAIRLESRIPRLDFILKGGFFLGEIYYLGGPAGSGKSLFANQFCYSLASRKKKCIYITVLVESSSKMLSHLRSMQFFDESVVSEEVYYLGAYGLMRKEGYPGLLRLIQNCVRERRATLLVIDGIQYLPPDSEAEQQLREFVHELQAFVNLASCTTLLIGQGDKRERLSPVESLVDGVLELSYALVGSRAVRELTVFKFRGSDFLQGKHEVEITSEGLQIHPRTEIQFSKPPEQAMEQRIRMGFGIKELDRMVKGGPFSGSCTVTLGAPGAGKTLLGLAFLVEGARQGQQGIYFGFQEPPPRLIDKAKAMGIELEKYVKNGSIEIIWQPPLEHFMDALAEQLLEKVRRDKKPRRRLFIDGNEGFRSAAVYKDRIPRFLSAFTNELRSHDVTTVISEELGLFSSAIDIPSPDLANFAETVILLRYVEYKSQVRRLVSVLKMRESEYDNTIREFRLTQGGIVVSGRFDDADNILSGVPRRTSSRTESEERP